jgi:hypothetical protein
MSSRLGGTGGQTLAATTAAGQLSPVSPLRLRWRTRSGEAHAIADGGGVSLVRDSLLYGAAAWAVAAVRGGGAVSGDTGRARGGHVEGAWWRLLHPTTRGSEWRLGPIWALAVLCGSQLWSVGTSSSGGLQQPWRLVDMRGLLPRAHAGWR